MSDAERLRKAADKREAQVRERQAYALTDVLGRPLDHSEDLAVIAMLRAVADDLDAPHFVRSLGITPLKWPVSPRTRAAALALADVILGGSDD